MRDGTKLFETLSASLKGFTIQHVILADYDPRQDYNSVNRKIQDANSDAQPRSQPIPGPISEPLALSGMKKDFENTWCRFQKDSQVFFEPTVQDAMETVRRLGADSGGMQILITGSLHLVAGALFSLSQRTANGSLETEG